MSEALHPDDECECGDFRKHHANGSGRCCMPDDLTHGNKTCFAFRLAFPHAGPRSRAALNPEVGESTDRIQQAYKAGFDFAMLTKDEVEK